MPRDNILKSAIRGLIPTALLPQLDLDPLTQDLYRFETEVQLAAGSAVVERCVAIARRPFQVVSVIAVPQAGVTANDTNYFTVVVNKRTAAVPGTPVAVCTAPAQITGGTGNWTAFAQKDLSAFLNATLANRVFALNDTMHVTVTKSGTGLVYPEGAIYILCERLSD